MIGKNVRSEQPRRWKGRDWTESADKRLYVTFVTTWRSLFARTIHSLISCNVPKALSHRIELLGALGEVGRGCDDDELLRSRSLSRLWRTAFVVCRQEATRVKAASVIIFSSKNAFEWMVDRITSGTQSCLLRWWRFFELTLVCFFSLTLVSAWSDDRFERVLDE